MNRPSLLALALVALVLGAGVAGVVNATAQSEPADEATTDSHPADHLRADAIVDRLQERYDLSDAQADELEALIVRLDDDGASRAEIARVVAHKLVEFGVEPTDIERDAFRLSLHRLSERFDLTERQTAELAEIVRTMHADGASRAETKRVVYAKLVEWDKLDRHPHAVAWLSDFLDLSDTEADQLTGLVADMRADGASRAEIRHAIARQLVAFGYTEEEVRHAALHYRLHCLAENTDITDEQLRELHSMIHRLYEDGASADEIRHAVHDKLHHEWDITRDRASDHRHARDRPRSTDRAEHDHRVPTDA
jgi:hypothetical protein